MLRTVKGFMTLSRLNFLYRIASCCKIGVEENPLNQMIQNLAFALDVTSIEGEKSNSKKFSFFATKIHFVFLHDRECMLTSIKKQARFYPVS